MTLRVNGQGSGAATVAAADITDAGAVGVDVVQADTLAAFAAILIASDPMAGTDWDDLAISGGASAAWGASKLTLTCPSGSAASCGVEQAGYLPSGESYDVAARVDVTAGDASSLTRLVLTAGQSASANASVILWSDGTVEWGHYGSGSFTSLGTTAGPDSGQRTGGQLWVRLTRTPVGIAFAWGVGSAGALPTEWTTVGISTAANVLARAGGRYVQIGGLTTSSLAFTVEVLAILAALPGGF